jgi:predicted Zn-dependent protease with MMP-like domain
VITPRQRELFDREFDRVMAALPRRARALLEAVSLAVEDYPSREIQAEMGVRRDELCGLYTGTPITEQSFDLAGQPSDLIHIYREGILALATGPRGQVDLGELREQIRTTVLHELGHYHGMDEDDLDALGYL